MEAKIETLKGQQAGTWNEAGQRGHGTAERREAQPRSAEEYIRECRARRMVRLGKEGFEDGQEIKGHGEDTTMFVALSMDPATGESVLISSTWKDGADQRGFLLDMPEVRELRDYLDAALRAAEILQREKAEEDAA